MGMVQLGVLYGILVNVDPEHLHAMGCISFATQQRFLDLADRFDMLCNNNIT